MRLITLLLGTCFLSLTAQASETFYLKIPGITGESTAKAFPGWIPATSFSEGFTTSGVGSATGSGRSVGRLVCHALQVIKQLDSSSAVIAADVATGQVFNEIDLVATSGGEFDITFLKFALHNAVISSVIFGGDSSTSAQVETLTVVAQRVDITYTPQNGKGAAGTPVSASVNCFGSN